MVKEYSVHVDAKAMISKLQDEGRELVWDRLKKQEPQCGYCSLGLSCRNCAMGPCRIDPFGEGPQRGVCGADADVIVARNLARAVASGAAAHSDHGRDLVEVLARVGKVRAYSVKDEGKLRRLAEEYGIDLDGKSTEQIAAELADAMLEDFGSKKERIQLIGRAPRRRVEVWEKLGVVSRGIDREIVELMHRTHMGVDNDPVNILLQCLRTSLGDGFGGSMIATEVSDILFGTPEPRMSRINLGVLKEREVNIILHGHNPVVSDAIVDAASSEEMVRLAKEAGAEGINLAGVCCTGTEVLMRRGVPLAGNHLIQELVIGTGVVDVIVVDYQCIMPAIVDVAKCYHTEVITTSPKAKFKGATHIEFAPENADERAREIVRIAIERFKQRRGPIRIPEVRPVELMTGFSVEAVLKALGGSLRPLIDAIKDGSIRGVVGSVGCNNPKVKQDSSHIALARRLIENDVLVVDTGCAAIADAKAGLKTPEAARHAGNGLRKVCEALRIPPVLHFGSCVDNSRILVALCAIASELGVDISDLPAAGAAMEWYSEKAIAIGTYFVASGLLVVLGVPPAIYGSKLVLDVLTSKVRDLTGGRFVVEPDPETAAQIILEDIEEKRRALGI